MKYKLPCAICDETVNLTGARYVELVRRDMLPVCRKNGCYRLVGISERRRATENGGVARVSQPQSWQGGYELASRRDASGCSVAGEPLAKRRISRRMETG